MVYDRPEDFIKKTSAEMKFDVWSNKIEIYVGKKFFFLNFSRFYAKLTVEMFF